MDKQTEDRNKENFWKSFLRETVAQKYLLKEFLGYGAYGGVFKAADMVRGKETKSLAVKLMLPANITEHELNFATNLAHHDNLIDHITGDEVTIRGTPLLYLVMELADRSLADLITERKQNGQNLDSGEAKEIVRAIAKGLEFLHEIASDASEDKKCVHRDLKPANILQVGKVWKIADFGFAKTLIDGNSMRSTTIVGTAHFVPPELLKQGWVSTKWDIFSLGVVIVQMLTGHYPFDAVRRENDEQVRLDIENAIKNKQPNLQGLPPEWMELVKGCLEKKNEYRWTATRVLSELEKIGVSNFNLQPDSSSSIRINGQTTKITSRDPSRSNSIWWIFVVLIAIAGGFYLWQNPKLVSSLRLPFIPTTPINDPKITISDTKAAALYVQAQEKHNKKDYKGAMDDFTEVIRLVPDYTDAYVFRGNTKDVLGDKQGAISDYNEAIRLKPNYALVYYNRGGVKANLGDQQGAISDYSKAIEINYNLSGVSLADVYVGRGGRKYDLGDKQGALTDYSKAIEFRSDFSLAYYVMGNTKLNLGDKQGALSDLNKAIEINRNWGWSSLSIADAYLVRGLTKFNLDDKQGALSDINKAIEIQSDYALAYYKIAAVKLNLGNKQEALSDLNKAIEINRNWGDGTYGISETYVSRGDTKNELGDKQGALSDYNKAIELKPENGGAYHSRGILKFTLGDQQGAIADYNEAIRLKPNYAYPYYGLGNSYKALGDKTKALENFRKAAAMLKQQNDTEWYRRALNEIAQLEK